MLTHLYLHLQFRGNFVGDGSQITNIELPLIQDGEVTASVSAENGFVVSSIQSGSTFYGNLIANSGIVSNDDIISNGNIQANIGSFFSGSGEGLTNIPLAAFAEEVVASTRIQSGSVTASVSPNFGFKVESTLSGSQFTGSVNVKGQVIIPSGSGYFSGSGEGLSNIPRSALTQDALLSSFIVSGSVTASVDPNDGFVVTSYASGSTFYGNVQLVTGSYSGSGAQLFNIPKSAISDLDTSKIFSGSVTASTHPENGFVVTSVASGSTFYGDIQLVTGSFSGSGANLFNIPRTALTEDALLSSFIASGSVTASVSPNLGFVVESYNSGSTFYGDVKLATGSFSGSGRNLFDIPFSNLTGDSNRIASGSATASISPNLGLVVNTSASIDGDLNVAGAINARELNVTFVNSEVIYSSGSNIFGDSLTEDTQQMTGSVEVTGSLTVDGVITGDGSGLFNIPQSALTEAATLIASGSVTASVEPNDGFVVTSVASGSTFFGDIKLATGSFSGSGTNLFDIPLAAFTPEAQDAINAALSIQSGILASGSVTASVSNEFGFRVESIDSGSQFTGSVEVSGNVTIPSGSGYFSGSGEGLFNIPQSAFSGDAFRIASGSVSASVSPDYGFVVESLESGSQFTGSLFVSGGIELSSGSSFSGSGARLFNIPRAAINT
jgi:hypothetical protein